MITSDGQNPEEVFEITDFTTASDWERFIARIEEVVHEWKLSNIKQTPHVATKDCAKDLWGEINEEIYFSDFKFTMRRHYRKDTAYEENDNVSGPNEEETTTDQLPAALLDMMNIENAFPGRAHCLTRWYGLQDFIVITPSENDKGFIKSESRMKLLLSSIRIAVSNSNCHVPVFVQVHDPKESFYQGICSGSGVTTDFTMAYLKNVPPKCRNLMGLLDIFREKLGTQTNQILVSTKFTFILPEWNQAVSWLQQPPDFDSVTPNIGTSDLAKLPFGPYEDPISEILLYTTWPQIHADVVVDTEFNSSFSPLEAPLWSLRVRMMADPRCLLGEYLEEFISICYHEKAGKRLVPESALSEENIGLALDRLTESMALKSISNVVGRAKKRLRKSPKEGCIPQKSLLEILYFIFPDAQDLQPSYGDGFESQVDRIERAFESEELKTLKEKMDQSKSAPLGSLPYVLALCMFHVNYSYGGLNAVSHLWQEFVLEMRYRWENNFIIPGLNSGSPHLGSGLLYQKLQMLNCCIERKKYQEQLALQRASTTREANSSDEDEFYDCDEEEYKGEEKEEPSASSKDQTFQDSVSQVAEGRSRKCGDLKLLHVDQPLFIPITQDPAPMTEDQLEQQAEVFVKLGADEEGKNLREKMQSVCLMADMQAFKAANPGCYLEDFVRWYSPVDWIDADTIDLDGKIVKKGRLSARMQIPGNTWQEVWHNAKPLAARKQKRLFDETKEAEKVMHFLANICPYDVVLHLIPMLVHLGIATIILAKKPKIKELVTMLECIATTTAKLTKSPKSSIQDYEAVIDQLSEAEATVARANAVCGLLTGACEGITKKDTDVILQEFALSLLEQPEVNIPDAGHGVLGKGIRKLFEIAYEKSDDDSRPSGMSQDCVLGSPAAKEMILRAKVARPAPHSTHTPQRMYCVLTDKDVRLAGAFTQDTTFF